MPDVIWDETGLHTLKTMWSAGHPHGAIALCIPCATRSAVAGKIMRLNLPMPSKKLSSQARALSGRPSNRIPNQSPTAPRADSKFNPPVNRALALKSRPEPLPRRNLSNSLVAKRDLAESEPGLPAHLDEPVVGTGMQLIDLERENCRFPFGHPNTDRFFFCGAIGADYPKRPYCPFHTAKVAGEPVNRKRFEGSALFAAGSRPSTTGAQHG